MEDGREVQAARCRGERGGCHQIGHSSQPTQQLSSPNPQDGRWHGSQAHGVMFSLWGVATTGQLGGPRAEATGPISTSNSGGGAEQRASPRNTLGPTNAGEPGPMQDKECQASELHLVLYM
ncbi:hypothetical protein EMCRGX_G012686 [Ephydatia muelleri]